MFESVPTIPMLNTYLLQLQAHHDKKTLTPTDLGVRAEVWKAIASNSYKIGKTVHLNIEIYTTATIVANNVYVVNVVASDGTYKNPVACTSLAKENGNLFVCIPKATNNYLFIDAEWECA